MPRVRHDSPGLEGTVEISDVCSCFGKKGKTSLRVVFMVHSETGDSTTLPSKLRALSYAVVLSFVALLLRNMYLQN